MARMQRKGNPSALLVGIETGAATVENSMELPQKKKKNGPAFSLSNSTSGIQPKNPKTTVQKNIRIPMFIAVLFIIAKIWKQAKCPSVHECIKELWDIYTMECYIAVKKKEFLFFVMAWMELETVNA